MEQWVNQERTGCRGASNTYSDTAIEFMVTIQSLYRCNISDLTGECQKY
ncbi:hypothetical protein ACP6PL_22540 [Dapis sp. BLCC M126]